MPAGPMKRKSVQKRLREIRAQATTQPMWVETPGWVLGPSDPSILLPHHEESGLLDQAALAAVSREEYLDVVAAAVEAREFPAWCDPESSWLRLLLYRDFGEHGPFCTCPPCTAKKPPAPPPQPAAPAGEVFTHEGATDRRSNRQTWREPDDRYEAEQERLRRAWADPNNHHFFTE